jgi:hypothetical protein
MWALYFLDAERAKVLLAELFDRPFQLKVTCREKYPISRSVSRSR